MVLRWWEWTILALAVIIGVLLLLMYFRAPTIDSLQNKELCEYSKFLKKANNGDLVLFSGDTRGERTCRWASGSPFSHVGIVFREFLDGKNILYIWEADVGQGSRKGPRIMKLEDKIAKYKGFKILGWTALKEELRPSREAILALVPDYRRYTLDNLMLVWVLSKLGLSKLLSRRRDSVFCSELVALSLQRLKILEGSLDPQRYSPGDFYLQKDSGNYLKTVFVKFPQ